MSRKLHVTNLGELINGDELGRMFQRCGNVRAVRIVRSGSTGRTVGEAFVEMAIENEGAAAIALLDGQELAGRMLGVRWATFRDESDAAKAATASPAPLVVDMKPAAGPQPGGFGDRSGVGSRGGQFHIPQERRATDG
jgi:RNA recognition motif-containing protein